MNTIFEVANAPIATANSSAAAVTIAAGALEADGDGLRSRWRPPSRASLIRESRNTP